MLMTGVEGKQVAYPFMLPSPLKPDAHAQLVKTIPSDILVKMYGEQHGYDASEDFAGLSHIALYHCTETGYRFFYPFTLEGKERLYRHLEQTDWCYEEDKWEHVFVASLIPDTASVLDVGCGHGAFLSKVRSPNVTGMELNASAAEFARGRGMTVVESLIGDHAKECPDHYDVVSAFQVLEHIADPIPFLKDCLAVLKPGGTLFIAVPNNASFMRYVQDLMPLNQPPHHVGLWSPDSLAALAKLLPMDQLAVIEEPLRELEWYQQIMEHRYLPKKWQRSIYYRLGGAKIMKRFIAENRHSISGHTVIASYRKLPG